MLCQLHIVSTFNLANLRNISIFCAKTDTPCHQQLKQGSTIGAIVVLLKGVSVVTGSDVVATVVVLLSGGRVGECVTARGCVVREMTIFQYLNLNMF